MANTNSILVNYTGSCKFPLIEPKTKTDLNPNPQQKNIHQHLIDDCVKNDAQAQKKIYSLYSIAIFNTCKRMVIDRDDAQDLLQEAFIAAFKGIGNYNGSSTFGAWLKRIAINKCINHLKRQKVIQFERLSEENAGELNDENDATETEYSIKEIQNAILKLPDGCRTVFVLKAMEGYDHKEIAHEMNISIGTSKSQYNRAKQLLQDLLKENSL